MKNQPFHLSDEQLLLELEGELSTKAAKKVRSHLQACWYCRVKQQDLESTIADFTRLRKREFEAKLPPAAGSRALLKARLSELSSTSMNQRTSWFNPFHRHVWALAIIVCCLLGFKLLLSRLSQHNFSHPPDPLISLPNAQLTPGATVVMSRGVICQQENVKNKAVSTVLQKKVFEEYGITKAHPKAYEVDYLITPALGGADDIHNLWPHSYSAAWNARVKDELEDRLRELVCDGGLDLTEAQQEIATNWIAAYRKYFHTDRPLPVHSNNDKN